MRQEIDQLLEAYDDLNVILTMELPDKFHNAIKQLRESLKKRIDTDNEYAAYGDSFVEL